MDEVCQSIAKGEQTEDKIEKITVKEILKKDITYNELPEDVKEYFQQLFDKLPQNIRGIKSQLEIVQRLKNILTTGYLRDILFDHIVKVKEKYKDSDDPNEWLRQINPTIVTKIKQMINVQSSELTELLDTGGFDDDDFKMEKVTLSRIMKSKKLKKNNANNDSNIIDAEFEVVKDDTN